MDELTLDNKKYLSSKRAAQVTGYAKDYVGQLCREGRVEARLVGRNWYILESSILEHRFGAEEPAADVQPTSEELESTWETPIYTPEPLETVPTLAPKPITERPAAAPVVPAPAANPQVLADMQSAWKEWFDREEKALPDASAMLLDDHEAENEPGKAAIEDDRPIQHEEFFPVHIERHAPAEPIPAPMRIEPLRPIRPVEPVIQRSRSEEASKPRPSTRVQPTFRVHKKRKAGKGAVIIRASLISLTGLVILGTVIGSGALDTIMTKTGSSFLTDFLSGTHQVSK